MFVSKEVKVAIYLTIAVILASSLSLNANSKVFINEILANGINDPDSEWVELFNNESFEASLTNWSISETSSSNFTFNATMPANSFIILTTSYSTFIAYYPNAALSGIPIINITISSFNLVDSGGEVRLYNSSGSLVDLIEYAQASGKKFENVSIGRYPDGSSAIFNLTTLTPGIKNDNQSPSIKQWIVPSGNNTKVSGIVNVTINITDDTTQVNSAIISFNGTDYSMLKSSKSSDLWYFLWNTSLNLKGYYNISIFFNDSYGKSNSEALLNVTIDNSPVIASYLPSGLTQTISENSSLMLYVNSTDYDDAVLNYSWLFDGIVNSTNPLSFEYKPGFNDNGTHTINSTVKDASSSQASIRWSIVVTNLNRPPLINITTSNEYSDRIIISETQKVNISAMAYDPDNDTTKLSVNDSRFFIEGQYFMWDTNLSDSGVYQINLTANDSIDIDSTIVNITIVDARDLDNDNNPDFNDTDDENDGINDTLDYLTGNITSIKSNIPLNITINGNISNLSGIFNGTYDFSITNGSEPLVDFNWTFNETSILDFGSINITPISNGSGAIIISGIDLSSLNFKKTAYVDKINTTVKSVCIKDMENMTLSNFTSACNGASESLVDCDNVTRTPYSCFDLGNRYKITGLNHSGVREQCIDNDGDGYGAGCAAGTDCNDNDRSKTTDCSSQSSSSSSSSSSGGGGGGGGGGSAFNGYICSSLWKCDDWPECINEKQTRDCNLVEVPLFISSEKCAQHTKPEQNRECAAPNKIDSCSDKVQNQGESGVDCGGPCRPCISLRIKNKPKSLEPESKINPNSALLGPAAVSPPSNVDIDNLIENLFTAFTTIIVLLIVAYIFIFLRGKLVKFK